jgi:hypothetical protein
MFFNIGTSSSSDEPTKTFLLSSHVAVFLSLLCVTAVTTCRGGILKSFRLDSKLSSERTFFEPPSPKHLFADVLLNDASTTRLPMLMEEPSPTLMEEPSLFDELNDDRKLSFF